MSTSTHTNTNLGPIAAATLGIVTSLATGLACVGPFIAILLGVSGFGWLTRYAYLRLPASALTAGVLLSGFLYVYRTRSSRCADRKRRRVALGLLWTATILALAINVFEYLILPRL